AHRDNRRARREREPGRPAPPATIPAHGTLREHREKAPVLERAPRTRERIEVTPTSLDRDRAYPVEQPREWPEPPELRLPEEAHVALESGPEDDSVEHRLVVPGDHRRPDRRNALGADDLDPVDGAHQASDQPADLGVGGSRNRHQRLIFVHRTADKG